MDDKTEDGPQLILVIEVKRVPHSPSIWARLGYWWFLLGPVGRGRVMALCAILLVLADAMWLAPYRARLWDALWEMLAE